MATHLAQGITSSYIDAANRLRPSGRLPEVYIYVEGLDDIAFWNACLYPYASKYSFKLTQLKRLDGGLAEGKGALIDAIGIQSLGRNKMIAVDSDYDWIIDNYHTSPTSPSYSGEIRNNPYILHTYLYSIENYKCHPACVQEMIVKLSNKIPELDIDNYFKVYSLALSELFLIHLVSADLCDGIYNLKDFRTDADKVNISFDGVAITPETRKYIEDRVRILDGYIIAHKSEIEGYRLKLLNFSFTPENYYLLFQGHIVANTLTKKHFQKVIVNLREQRIAEINAEGTEQQKCQRRRQFVGLTGVCVGLPNNKLSQELNKRLDQLIYDCTDITKASIGYSMIANDLASVF